MNEKKEILNFEEYMARLASLFNSECLILLKSHRENDKVLWELKGISKTGEEFGILENYIEPPTYFG